MKPLCLFALLVPLAAAPVAARPTGAARADTTAWKHLLRLEGVEFSFIFYRMADDQNDGVVVKLVNTNDYPVEYAFRMVFRGDGRELVAERTTGRLEAGQAKTGELSDLWWIPFRDGAPVREVGMRGFRIRRVEDAKGRG